MRGRARGHLPASTPAPNLRYRCLPPLVPLVASPPWHCISRCRCSLPLPLSCPTMQPSLPSAWRARPQGHSLSFRCSSFQQLASWRARDKGTHASVGAQSPPAPAAVLHGAVWSPALARNLMNGGGRCQLAARLRQGRSPTAGTGWRVGACGRRACSGVGTACWSCQALCHCRTRQLPGGLDARGRPGRQDNQPASWVGHGGHAGGSRGAACGERRGTLEATAAAHSQSPALLTLRARERNCSARGRAPWQAARRARAPHRVELG